MPTSEPSLPAVYVLRRLHGKQWEQSTQQVRSSAFILRDGETGISVFAATHQTPYTLLNKFLAEQREKWRDDAAKSKIWQEKDVSVLVKENWRVARLPITAIPSQFHLTPPDESGDGHQEIRGSKEDFETYADFLAQHAILCTSDECLNQP